MFLGTKCDVGCNLLSNASASPCPHPKKYTEINVAKCEQFLNLGGGQIGIHCIIFQLFCIADIFKDKNWDEVERGDPRKGCPNKNMSVQNTEGGQFTTGENSRDSYLRLRFQSWVDWFVMLLWGLRKKAIISQEQQCSCKTLTPSPSWLILKSVT